MVQGCIAKASKRKCCVISRICKGVLIFGAFFAFFTGAVTAGDYASIQLVGNFNGISCEPSDTDNNMEPAGEHLWRKLKFINEPGDPDTIDFKFTADNSYFPKHWGWSFTYGWGIADFDWSPSSIVALLPDSGYYYFFFNDTTYEYYLERPDAAIDGVLLSDKTYGVPDGATVTLFNVGDGLIGTYSSFSDSLFSFSELPGSVFSLTASAPGYEDTTITGITTSAGQTEHVSILLKEKTAVMITSAAGSHVEEGILIRWTAGDNNAGFDIYGGDTPLFAAMEKRNAEEIRSESEYFFLDRCDDRTVDRYYFIVEAGDDSPTYFGPLLVGAISPEAGNILSQNYPNPFNPSTTLPYRVGSGASGSRVTIAFYDVSGRLVDRHDLGIKPAGDHSFEWNPSLSTGKNLHSGVYYCRLQIGKEILTRKMILLR